MRYSSSISPSCNKGLDLEFDKKYQTENARLTNFEFNLVYLFLSLKYDSCLIFSSDKFMHRVQSVKLTLHAAPEVSTTGEAKQKLNLVFAFVNRQKEKQAGAELCQAQHSLSLDLDTN